MKDIIKILLFSLAVFCFILACEQKEPEVKPEPKQLTAMGDMYRLGDTMPAGLSVGPAELRIVPGISWIEIVVDSLGNEHLRLLSQNPITGIEGWVTENTILTWLLRVLPDSLDIEAGADTLTISAIGDSISIQGSNSVQVAFRVFGVDQVSNIYENSFPLGSRIINRANGAQYLVQSSAVSGYTTDSMAVIPTGSRYAVLQPQQGQYDITHFGAVGDGVTNNGDILYKASRFGRPNRLTFPAGVFLYDSSIMIGSYGINMSGIGGGNFTTTAATVLQYTGTGSAIDFDHDILSGSFRTNRLLIENLAIVGTGSALYGINLDRINHLGSITTAKISNVSIKGFTADDSYGLYITRTYNLLIEGCHITDNANGIYFGTEAIGVNVSNTWVRNSSRYNIHNAYGGNNRINDCIITAEGTAPSTQRGIYVQSGDLIINSVLLEGNYHHIETISNSKVTVSDCKFNAFAGAYSCVFADGSRVFLSGNMLGANNAIDAGLGTEWIGEIEGHHDIPTISADNPVGFATITKMSGNFTLTDFASTAIPSGIFCLVFENDSVTIQSRELTQPFVYLKDGINFKGYNGDRLYLQKKQNISGSITLHEVSRVRHQDNYMQNKSSSYTVLPGDHELTFTNKGATGTVMFTLPSPIRLNDNMQYTFIKLTDQPMRIQTTGSPRRIQGGTATSYLQLNHVGSTVTLRIDSLVYEIISSGGMYSFSDPNTGHAGGNFAGVGMAELRDSLAMVSYTQDYVLLGSGTPTHATTANITTNNSATSFAKRFNINNGSDAYLYAGVGYEPNGVSGLSTHRPNITAHLEDGRNSTGSALSLYGMRFNGTYAAKTDMDNDTMNLAELTGQGWRTSGPRVASSVVLAGGKNMGSSFYNGVIQFKTTNSTTLATRATIHRNGDFYLGDGLPQHSPASPSAKLYLRASNTTASEYALLVQNSTPTSLMSVRNGGEVNIGSMTDIGNYILQVTGRVYIDDVLTLKPTTEPGSPAKGMIYVNDSDSHIYFYNGSGWVQLDN